jgi:hypothetical protein
MGSNKTLLIFAFLSLLQQFSRWKASANSFFGCLYFPSSELSARLCARPLRASIGVLVNREGKPVKNFSRLDGKMLVRKIEEAHGHAKHTQDQPLSGEHASRAIVIDRGVFVRRCARDSRANGLSFAGADWKRPAVEALAERFESPPK